MQLVIKEKKKIRINKIFELLLYLVGYIISFIIVTNLFDSVYIDLNHYFIYSILIVTILSVLNKTIKPILVTLTIPITGATLGIFYLFINLLIVIVTIEFIFMYLKKMLQNLSTVQYSIFCSYLIINSKLFNRKYYNKTNNKEGKEK